MGLLLTARSGLIEDEPEEALQAFKEIVTAEEEKGDWLVMKRLLPIPFDLCPFLTEPQTKSLAVDDPLFSFFVIDDTYAVLGIGVSKP